ncbi:MAG: YceI family protein [Proteobacteria bacterium]|nr:YceI family protein [Pseudomonadota bacterium]
MAAKRSIGWVLLLMAATSVGPATRAAERYRLDSTNTQVSFEIHHLGFQWVSARFPDIAGEFVLDRSGPQSRVDVTVGIATLQCSEPRWNDRLTSPAWLDAARFPQMSYHSGHIELERSQAMADGELTLHGVTRPVMLTVTFLDCPTGGDCQFAARGRIRRSEFGLPHGFWSGGDQVEIAISGTTH